MVLFFLFFYCCVRGTSMCFFDCVAGNSGVQPLAVFLGMSFFGDSGTICYNLILRLSVGDMNGCSLYG